MSSCSGLANEHDDKTAAYLNHLADSVRQQDSLRTNHTSGIGAIGVVTLTKPHMAVVANCGFGDLRLLKVNDTVTIGRQTTGDTEWKFINDPPIDPDYKYKELFVTKAVIRQIIR